MITILMSQAAWTSHPAGHLPRLLDHLLPGHRRLTPLPAGVRLKEDPDPRGLAALRRWRVRRGAGAEGPAGALSS